MKSVSFAKDKSKAFKAVVQVVKTTPKETYYFFTIVDIKVSLVSVFSCENVSSIVTLVELDLTENMAFIPITGNYFNFLWEVDCDCE